MKGVVGWRGVLIGMKYGGRDIQDGFDVGTMVGVEQWSTGYTGRCEAWFT